MDGDSRISGMALFSGKKEMIREPGFYVVKYRGEWTVGQVFPNAKDWNWLVFDSSDPLIDSELDEIGQKSKCPRSLADKIRLFES